MNNKTETRLSDLKYYATRYEIVCCKGNTTLFVTFTKNNSKQCLRQSITNRAKSLAPFCPSNTLTPLPNKSVSLGDWVVRFSGRTERQAILEGEYLPFRDYNKNKDYEHV